MSKSLEALERLKNTLLAEGYWQDVLQDVAIIEKELKEYEEMKRIKGTTTFDKAIEDTLINACPNVAKELKALEIIKKKYLDPHDFVLCYYTMNNEKWIDYEEYKKAYLNYYENDEYMLTQEEYDLLKEVLW